VSIYRLDDFREAVRSQGGDWTTRRACSVLAQAGIDVSAERARLMLNRLAEEGLLIKHGVRGRLWTQAVPPTVEYQIQFLDSYGRWQWTTGNYANEQAARGPLDRLRSRPGSFPYRLVKVTIQILDQPAEESS